METINVIITPEGKAREVNPLGKKPELFVPHFHASEEDRHDGYLLNRMAIEKWAEAESKLRTFEIECKYGFNHKVCVKANCCMFSLKVGKQYSAEIINKKTVRIIN